MKTLILIPMDNDNINEKIERTLQSLDDLREVQPAPYFYKKLKVRMEVRNDRVKREGRWALAAVIVLLLLNGLALGSYWTNQQHDQDPVGLLAEEYNVQIIDIYDTEEQ